MAIWTICPNCQKRFSAQDSYLRKRVKCPSCQARVEVLASEDQEAMEAWREEQEKRLALFEEMEQTRLRTTPSYALEFGTGLGKVRNFNPGALSRFQKLRALSRFMILGAYFLFAVVAVCAAVVLTLYGEGLIENTGVLLLFLLLLTIVLIFVFFVFKFLGELSWLLADLGDHQVDVRNLLLDLRDDVDRVLAAPREEKTSRKA